MTQTDTEKAINYLFGELDTATRDALEDRIFADEDFALFLGSVEKDLIDDYTRGEMDTALRRRFEQKYLTSETRREKVRVSHVLQKELFAEKPSRAPAAVAETKPSFWQQVAEFFRMPNLAMAGGLAAVLLLFLLGWILLRKSANGPEIAKNTNDNREIKMPTPQISPATSPAPDSTSPAPPYNSNAANNAGQTENKPIKKPVPTAAPTEKRETAPPQPRIFAATLLPIVRSGAAPVLRVPNTAETVRLRVVHDNLRPFTKYRVEIRNSDGDTVFVREIPVNEKNLARPVNLNIKSSALAAGSYEMTLSGIADASRAEPIKFYNFTVTKK